MKDLIDRQALLAEYDRLHVGEPGRARKMIEDAPSAQPEKRYTKADYIMALHKEYGCPLEAAEKAHDAALEYLRSLSKLKG